MFTTEDEAASRAGEEPPFLQEPTVHVQDGATRSWQDRFSDFMDYQRPPLMLLIAAAIIGLGVIMYFQRPDSQDAADPLLDAKAPLPATAGAIVDDSADVTIINPTPASVGPFIGLSDRPSTTVASPTTVPRTQTTAARTTAAPTTQPTTQPPTTVSTIETTTTTTEPATTQPPTTIETTTTAPPTTDGGVCSARIRRSDAYSGPSKDSDKLGKVRGGTYPVLAFSEANGGWIQLELPVGAGWVEADRVRGLEGACD